MQKKHMSLEAQVYQVAFELCYILSAYLQL